MTAKEIVRVQLSMRVSHTNTLHAARLVTQKDHARLRSRPNAVALRNTKYPACRDAFYLSWSCVTKTPVGADGTLVGSVPLGSKAPHTI